MKISNQVIKQITTLPIKVTWTKPPNVVIVQGLQFSFESRGGPLVRGPTPDDLWDFVALLHLSETDLCVWRSRYRSDH